MLISKIWGIFTVTRQSAQAFFQEIWMQLKNNMPSNHKLKKQQVQYSVPGPRPVLAAPPRPHSVPAAGGFSAEVTDLSEPRVPGLCPAAKCESTEGCIKPANHNDDLNQKRKWMFAYLSQKLREHFHVIVSLAHLIHTISTEDWPEKDFLLAWSTKVGTHHVHAMNSQKQYTLQAKGHTAIACHN